MLRSHLPLFLEARVPRPELPHRRFRIRFSATLAVAVGIAYLGWRTLCTLDLAVWWISVPFLLLEVHAVVSLGLFAFSLWDVDTRPRAGTIHKPPGRVAVFIPTYNESREILLPAIAAAVALQPEHETWVLDDGCRPEVRTLARELNAKYLARRDRTGAKAGNINNALETVDADFIAILDADHVARPNFLRHTLGYFRDPRVAVVQTPQDFYNLDSFEHEKSRTAYDQHLYHEQQLFYRAILPGKNRWEAAFWCGTNAVLRVAALREIGGVATETVTEDIHTTIRLHRRGWKSVYHNEILARGLAADTARQFQLQRLRWGSGAMRVLRLENPLTNTGLSLTQRLAYASTLLGWFDAWRSLGYVLVPSIVLFTGAMPVRTHPVAFAIAFGLTFTVQQAALRLLSRGYHRLVLSIVFDFVRMTPCLLATLTLFWPLNLGFRVTPKGRQDDAYPSRIGPPPLLLLVAAICAVAAAWFVLTIAGKTPIRYDNAWFAYASSFWLALNLALVVIAIGRVTSSTYAPERRASVRFAAGLASAFDGCPCRIHQISLTGAQISLKRDALDSLGATNRRHGLTVAVLRQCLAFGVFARWHREAPHGRVLVGLEFAPGQTAAQASLALAVLNRDLRPMHAATLPLAA